MAFAFDYQDSEQMINGLRMLMEGIANNSESYTHKNVRALARSAVIGVNELDLPDSLKAQIRFLLGCLSLARLPHYDRAGIANHISFLIMKHQEASRLDNLTDVMF